MNYLLLITTAGAAGFFIAAAGEYIITNLPIWADR